MTVLKIIFCVAISSNMALRVLIAMDCTQKMQYKFRSFEKLNLRNVDQST